MAKDRGRLEQGAAKADQTGVYRGIKCTYCIQVVPEAAEGGVFVESNTQYPNKQAVRSEKGEDEV